MSIFRTSISVFEVFKSPVSSLLLAELSLQRSLVHKVTKKVLGKFGNIRKTLLRLRLRWLVIEEI